MHVLRIILFILLSSSTLTAQTSVETTIQVLSDDLDIIKETITTIESRLLYAGYNATIQAADSAQLFLITSTLENGSKTDSTLFFSQLEDNQLSFGIAKRRDDPMIRLLYKDLTAVDGLLMHAANDPSVIFISRDPQLLDEQLDNLKQRIAALPHQNYTEMAFCWSTQPVQINNENESYMAHVLYAYDGSTDYSLHESSFLSTNILTSTKGMEIHFELIPEACESWSALTQQAAGDNARAVLFMLNNEVIYAPRMRSAIHSGKGKITGIRNRSGAMDITRKMNIGRLPADVDIVRVIKGTPIKTMSN